MASSCSFEPLTLALISGPCHVALRLAVAPALTCNPCTPNHCPGPNPYLLSTAACYNFAGGAFVCCLETPLVPQLSDMLEGGRVEQAALLAHFRRPSGSDGDGGGGSGSSGGGTARSIAVVRHLLLCSLVCGGRARPASQLHYSCETFPLGGLQWQPALPRPRRGDQRSRRCGTHQRCGYRRLRE